MNIGIRAHPVADQKISLRFPASDRKDYLKIKFDMFKKAYSNFKFEPVLLYAYFGRLILDKSASDFERRETTHTGIGRRDMIEFFGWLREQGVRMIVKVIVEDREQPHSDDAVEEALKDFKIEILDWRKLDLCPRTILDACDSHLQEVHLWWSGNNAVLRSWSDPDGLVQLRNLRCIHLHLAKVISILILTFLFTKHHVIRMDWSRKLEQTETSKISKIG